MPQYILVCNHPCISEYDPDDIYPFHIFFVQKVHIVPEAVSDDKMALKWAEDHAKEEVCYRDGGGQPPAIKVSKSIETVVKN